MGLQKFELMRNPRITGYDQEIYEVALDDGSSIKCTGNHKFLLKNLSEKTAADLSPNDSLMIMTKWQTNWEEIMREEKGNGCLNYWMINTGKYNQFEHTFIYEQLQHQKLNPSYVIHHKDYNGTNNQLSNFEKMPKKDHDELHYISGSNNPMIRWWSRASDREKAHYHQKMSISTCRT